MRSSRTIAMGVALLLGIWAVAACGGGSSNGAGTSTSTTTVPVATTLVATTTTTSMTTTTSTTTALATSTTLPVPPAPHVFPIQGTTNVQYARAHHDYPAADMFAQCGSTVVAVTRARIHEVSLTDQHDPSVDDPELRGGLSVSYIDDDLVRYYGSHLSGVAEGIAPGVMVEAGQTIGFVGDTGNAAGTGCHLHFGLSSPCGGTLRQWEVRRGVVAPQPYLDSWRNGEDVNPAPEIRTWEAENPDRC